MQRTAHIQPFELFIFRCRLKYINEGAQTEETSSKPTMENLVQKSIETNLNIAPNMTLDIEGDATLTQIEVDEQIQRIRAELGVSTISDAAGTEELPITGELDMRILFLSGASSSEQFLAEIFSRDQSDATRSSAERNLSLLNDPEIAARLQNDPGYKDEYQNARSLSAFHIAQQRLNAGDISGAIPFLEMADNAATQVAWGSYGGWQKYVKATIAYTNGDALELSRIYDELPDDDSYKEVLGRLKNGLESGSTDYARDYGGL